MHASPPESGRLPALLLGEPATGGGQVAALPLLDRLLVAVHRVGCGPIRVVCAGELPVVRRARALAVRFEVIRAIPPFPEPTSPASTDQLVQAGDLKSVAAARATLVTSAGERLPAGSRDRWQGSVADSLAGVPAVVATGVAAAVRSAADATVAERALWASLTSSSDGFLDKWFNRPVGRPLSKLIIRTPIIPNQVSLASIVTGTVAGVLFGFGQHGWSVLAGALFPMSAIVDCVDGDVARSVFKESPLGKWLDLVGDQVAHAAVFIDIAVGLWRSGLHGPFLALGGSAVLGGLIAFAVVVRGMAPKGEPNRRLQKLMDGATSRDLSVLALALACAQHPEWFLWIAAIGRHVFWVLAPGLQLVPSKPAGVAK
jgi:phosphatidylglycerophosphate synthase